jgi:hypothetical protein
MAAEHEETSLSTQILAGKIQGEFENKTDVLDDADNAAFRTKWEGGKVVGSQDRKAKQRSHIATYKHLLHLGRFLTASHRQAQTS